MAASEKERQSLLDRLLAKNRIEAIGDNGKAAASSISLSPRVIAPPYVGPEEVQEAVKSVWIAEEASYLASTFGYDEYKAHAEAERVYEEQHRAII